MRVRVPLWMRVPVCVCLCVVFTHAWACGPWEHAFARRKLLPILALYHAMRTEIVFRLFYRLRRTVLVSINVVSRSVLTITAGRLRSSCPPVVL